MSSQPLLAFAHCVLSSLDCDNKKQPTSAPHCSSLIPTLSRAQYGLQPNTVFHSPSPSSFFETTLFSFQHTDPKPLDNRPLFSSSQPFLPSLCFSGASPLPPPPRAPPPRVRAAVSACAACKNTCSALWASCTLRSESWQTHAAEARIDASSVTQSERKAAEKGREGKQKR